MKTGWEFYQSGLNSLFINPHEVSNVYKLVNHLCTEVVSDCLVMAILTLSIMQMLRTHNKANISASKMLQFMLSLLYFDLA